MCAFVLPKAHTLRATWVPLHFYPLLGSADCITVAVVAIDSAGNCQVHKSNNLSKLNCFFGEAGSDLIRFVDMSIEAVRVEVARRGLSILEEPINLGSSFVFGKPNAGSGFELVEIAAAWLGKISMLQFADSAHVEEAQSLVLAGATQAVSVPAVRKEKKLVPAVRDELRALSPIFASNFEKEYTLKDRRVPVKLNYSGERLVADFDRVSPKNIGASLERVRSKLWVLAEHRDSTKHETPRFHEMLVVPTTLQDAILDRADMRIVDEACDDIESEADRREIRLRRFPSTREMAAHIFRIESGAQPVMIQ